MVCMTTNAANTNEALTKFNVWTLWTDLAELLITVDARDEEHAMAIAVRMGLVSGLGTRPSYQGLHAQPAR